MFEELRPSTAYLHGIAIVGNTVIAKRLAVLPTRLFSEQFVGQMIYSVCLHIVRHQQRPPLFEHATESVEVLYVEYIFAISKAFGHSDYHVSEAVVMPACDHTVALTAVGGGAYGVDIVWKVARTVISDVLVVMARKQSAVAVITSRKSSGTVVEVFFATTRTGDFGAAYVIVISV